jgi:CheY-like chemotaxis protein
MSEPAPRGASPLAGLTVLIVEDETIISFLIEDMALELGAGEICHAAGVAEALAFLAERRPDTAIVDVNLGGELAYPVAERLAALGVPFVFATGYGRQGVSVPPGVAEAVSRRDASAGDAGGAGAVGSSEFVPYPSVGALGARRSPSWRAGREPPRPRRPSIFGRRP